MTLPSLVTSFFTLLMLSLPAYSAPDYLEKKLPVHLHGQLTEDYKVSPGTPWMAVIGDSSTTGAGAHPAIKGTVTSAIGKFGAGLASMGFNQTASTHTPRHQDWMRLFEFNIIEGQLPTRVLYSKAEFEKPRKPPAKMNVEARGSLLLDSPVFSFGNMVGRSLNFKAENIVFVGQDGKRFTTFGQQLDRIMEVSPGGLPPLILSSYAANDICQMENFTGSLEEFEVRYGNSVGRQIKKLAHYQGASEGTEIYFLAPLDVSILLDDPSIAKQRIPFPGFGPSPMPGPGENSISCGELREGGRTEFRKHVAKLFHIACPGILTPPVDKQVHRQRVQDLQSLQIKILKKNIKAWNRDAKNNIRAHLAPSVRDIKYEEGDLANDCFHPGIGAHTRIAKSLLENELADYSHSRD